MDLPLLCILQKYSVVTGELLSEFARFECSLDGFVRGNQQCGSGTAGVWQIYKPDGNYTLSVRGRDINGNTGSVVSHSFRVGKFSCFCLLAFYLVWSLALFLLGCFWDGLSVRCCPYYRYNLPLLI